jgi:DNA-binding GntR family transcriptional regulator
MTETASRQVTPRRYEIVEAVLRRNIADGRLPRGLVLLEGPIAELLQTSRAPVQRALQTLEADGLVHRFDGRGFLVGPAGEAIAPLRRDLAAIGLETSRELDAALQSRGAWKRIYDKVEADVAACMIFGQYRLVEAELAQHFHVSRTVVRDVLGRLQQAGLVRKDQSSHWVAGPLTAQSIKDHFALRKILEPPALIDAAPRLERAKLSALYDRLCAAERHVGQTNGKTAEAFEPLLIDTCVLATGNERLIELIRDNLIPILAADRLLRQLGLPEDGRAISEQRMIVELLLQDAVEAAAAMLGAHIDAAAQRGLAQMKIVAVVSEPADLAPYLTRVTA